MKFQKITVVLICTVLVTACSSTRIVGSWKNADIGAVQYGNIMIVGLTKNAVAKNNVEGHMAAVLGARGVDAKGSGSIFNPEVKVTEEMKKEVAGNLASSGYDALLTLAQVSVEEKTDYVPGTAYTPYAYPSYGSYWGYYGYYAPQVYSPGYYTTEKVYTIEANLYDVATEKLVWAARSETTSPSNLDRFAEEYAETVVFQLKKDGMLKTKD